LGKASGRDPVPTVRPFDEETHVGPDQNKQTQLLDALMQNELIKAAIVIDEFGHAKGLRGRARCLRMGDDDAKATLMLNQGKKGSRESVYIAAAGGTDFLIVVFDEQVSFDSLKLQIDEAIARVGLKP
jgi:hypothetical protein